MPGMSGIEVLRCMRNEASTCHIPVILVSADVSEQNELAGLNLGADEYLNKPISKDTLIIRLRNLQDVMQNGANYAWQFGNHAEVSLSTSAHKNTRRWLVFL